MSIRLAALLPLALFSCRHPPPPVSAPAPAPVADGPAAAVTPVDAGPPPSLCDRALATHRAVRARQRDDAPWNEALDTFGKCLATPHGAWVVALDALTPSDPDASDDAHLDGVWSVQHVDASGAAVRAERRTTWAYFDLLRVEHASAFDYDGDGEPELVLHTNEAAHESADVPRGEVLTFRDGAVSAYAPAEGIEPVEARDVDGDGRPDLLGNAPYVGDGDDSPSDFTYNMSGPQLVAHAVAGGQFSRNDDVAKRAIRAVCPQRVATVFGADTSQDSAATAVVCARVWGVPAATVTREITRRCASVAESSSPSANLRRRRCGDVRVLTRWAGLVPPVTLP